MAQKMYEESGDNNIERICNELKEIRKEFGARKQDLYPPGYEEKESWSKLKNKYRMREVPEDLLEKPFDIFLGVKPEIVLVNKDTQKWVNKNKNTGTSIVSNCRSDYL